MGQVGIIGVGNIGTGMAESLLREGFKLTVYDKRKEPLEELAQKGVEIASPFSWMLSFFNDRDGRAMYWARAFRGSVERAGR